ncbi:MAG: hypothetical protein AAF514_16660, partial [Verrucomicrobiota bacterium]
GPFKLPQAVYWPSVEDTAKIHLPFDGHSGDLATYRIWRSSPKPTFKDAALVLRHGKRKLPPFESTIWGGAIHFDFVLHGDKPGTQVADMKDGAFLLQCQKPDNPAAWQSITVKDGYLVLQYASKNGQTGTKKLTREPVIDTDRWHKVVFRFVPGSGRITCMVDGGEAITGSHNFSKDMDWYLGFGTRHPQDSLSGCIDELAFFQSDSRAVTNESLMALSKRPRPGNEELPIYRNVKKLNRVQQANDRDFIAPEHLASYYPFDRDLRERFNGLELLPEGSGVSGSAAIRDSALMLTAGHRGFVKGDFGKKFTLHIDFATRRHQTASEIFSIGGTGKEWLRAKVLSSGRLELEAAIRDKHNRRVSRKVTLPLRLTEEETWHKLVISVLGARHTAGGVYLDGMMLPAWNFGHRNGFDLFDGDPDMSRQPIRFGASGTVTRIDELMVFNASNIPAKKLVKRPRRPGEDAPVGISGRTIEGFSMPIIDPIR